MKRIAGSMPSGATRRQFLAGGAAVVAGGAAHAGWHRMGFAYLDQARRTQVRLLAFSDQGQVFAKADERFAWSRETFGPTASFSITDGENGENSVLTVRQASLPGTGTFEITVRCRKSKIGDWELAATVSSFWDNGAPVTALAVPAQAMFAPYLAPSPVAICEIDERKRTAALLRALFGQRVEAEGGVRLSLSGFGLWSIECAPRTSKPPGRMYALAVPMSFDKIDLFVTKTVLETTVSGDTPADGRTAAWAASTPRTSSTARGFAGPLLFDEAVIHALRDQANVQSIEGLYGRIGWRSLRFEGNSAGPKPAIAPRSTATDFVLAARRLANGKTLEARIELDREPPAGASEAEPPEGHGIAALRHWGDPRYSIAGYVRKGQSALRPIGRLSFVNGLAGEAEGPFAFSKLTVTRQLERSTDGKAPFVMTRASATPIAKETLLSTSSGGFEVSALPSVTERPGAGSRVPEISLSARDAAPGRAVGVQERVLERFGAELALSWAGIALPERVGDAGAGPERGTHLTRLSFSGAQAHFYLPLLGPPPRNAADALIPIGPELVANGGASVDAELDLSSARLSVSRPRDLLSLTFRFSGLVLQLPWRAPGKAARIVAHGGRSACRARGTGPDDRPLLVVDFPPQHVMEQAVFRQLSLPPKLPAYPHELSESSAPHFEILARPKRRTLFDLDGSPAKAPTDSELRIKTRNHLVAIAKNAESENAKAFIKFSDEFAKATAGKGFPREQCIYVGEAFLDPDVRRVAIDVARRGQGGVDVPESPPADLYPDVELLPLARAAVLRPIVERLRSEAEKPELGAAAKAAAGRWLKAVQGNDEDLLPFVPEEEKVAEIYAELEKAKEASSRRYADFRRRYRSEAAGFANLAEYRGAVWYGTRNNLPDPLKTFMAKESAAWRAQNEEPTPEVAEARLSGPSRIAFRVNCDDHEQDRAGGTIPFSLEAITDWASFDMAVVRRAERLMQSRPDGTLAPRWERKPSIDDGAILRFQGIRPGDHLARAETGRDGRSTTASRLSSRISVSQRMAEIHAATCEPPNAFETALELPARLFLSPGQDATWRTPRPSVAREAARSLKRELASDRTAASEVWSAALAEVGLPNLKSEEANRSAGGLRAVWSPDYRPEALLSLDGPGAPPRGPIAPWAIPRSIGTRSGNDPASRAALAALDQRRFRTSLDAYDRHELVALTSAHGLPVLGRRLASGALAPDGGQFDPPPGYRLDGLGADKTPQGDREADFSAIYRPKVLEISELTLSALGANLDLDTAFVPPASARGKDGKNLFDAFAVERWRHRMVLGRDVTVEVVYKGYLFPIGHRASLVKLTERRLEWTAGSAGPVAVLVQRMFLRVGEPEKSFRAYGQPNEGRRWPAERVTLLTRRTPDIVDPSEASLDKREKVHNSGRYNPPGSTGLMFWPRLSRSDQSEVWFEMLMGRETVPVRLPLMFVDNAAANDPETISKLVDYYNNGEALKPPASAPNVAAVASEQGPSPSRRLMRGAEPTAMAADYKPGDTSFQAGWWDIKAEGRETNAPVNETAGFRINNANFVRDAFMEGLDQPPFYPFIDAAKLRLTQVERATAADTEVWGVFGYDGKYAAEGFPKRVEKAPGNGGVGQAPTSEEIYLRLREQYLGKAQTALKFSLEKRGEAAGAVGQPNQDIVGISRQHGLVANSDPVALGNPGAAPKAAGDEASPPTPSLPRPNPGNFKEFLANMLPSNAKLLGLMELKDVLLGAADLMAKQPVLQEALDYGAAGVAGGLAEVRAVLVSTIIEPGLQLVDKVREEWMAVSRRKVALLGSGNGALPTLSQAYPELDADLEQLRKGLSSARDGSVSDTAFFAGLATLHETGRRLIRTIARIAHDPFAAAANDGDIGAVKKIIEILRDPAALLKGAREQLASEIATVAKLVSGRVDRYLVLDIVLPHRFLDGASATDVRAALSAFETATRAAIAQAVLDTATKVIGEGKNRVETRTELADFLTDAIINATSKVEADKTTVREAVVGALSSLADRLTRTPDKTLDLLATPEFKKFLDFADAVHQARIALKERPEPKTLFSAVATVSGAFLVVLDLPPVEVPAAPDPICRKALEVVSAAIALLPTQDAVAIARKEIVATAGAPLTKLRAACAAIGIDIEPLHDKLVAFGSTLAALLAASAEAPEMAVAPGADACAVLSAGSARWLRVVTVQRGHATTALNETVSATVTLFDQITKMTDPEAKSTAIAALRELAVPLANQARNLLTTTAAAAVKIRIDALSAAIKAIEADAWLKVVAAELIQAIDGAFLNGFAQAMMRVEAAAKSVAETKADEDVDTLRDRLGKLDEAAKAVLEVVKDFDVALASATERVVAGADKALDAALAPVAAKFIELLRPISKLYDDAAKNVAGLDEKLVDEASGGDATKKFISLLLDAFARTLGVPRLLKVAFKDREGKDGVDRFSYEAKLLLEAVADAPGMSAQARLRRMEQAVRFAFFYDGVKPAPLQLLDRALHVDGQILKTVAIQALNLEGLRRELEALIRELVPVKARLSYDFASAVGPLAGIFMPANGTELVLASRTEVDLLRPTKPVIDVDGSLGPFAIKLFGPFHAVTLHFLGVDYRSRNGGGNLQVRFGEVEIGEHAKFLEQLQSYLSPGEGAGFRLVPLSNRPGLEAGYGVNLGTFGVGTLSFSNVSLNAAARLPFDNSSAEFAISVGRSDAPFLISSTIFGGGGYLQLTATAKGIVGLEASFNYGGVFAFAFGPLVGQGQLTLGCYINKRKGQDIELGMVFQISGSAKIACFGVMASLYVRLTMQDGQMRGTAVFTYSFKLAIKDLTFRIRVSRNEGGRLGGGDSSEQPGGERKTTAKPYAEKKQATLDRWPVPSLDVETAYASNGRRAKLELAPNMPDATSLSASRAYFDPAPLPEPYL